MRKLLLILSIIFLVSSLQARNLEDQSSQSKDDIHQRRVHRAANIDLSVTNYGRIGSDNEFYSYVPSCEFPDSSEIDYLFQGCLWVGALVEDPDNPGELDTLVSIGSEGWWSGIIEFTPPANNFFWEENELGDEEYYAVYYDTTIQGVEPDPNDNRDHIPLGLKITQHSICWSSVGYDEFFIFNYYIENISENTLNDMWIGLYYDGDVLHDSEDPYGEEQGAQDDLCGFIEHGNFGIGWTADNDGQPGSSGFSEYSPTNVMALYLLGSSTPGLQTNFNWWMSDIDSPKDWGPVRQENERVFPGGGRGTPGGDPAKYFVMANGEHDYDQAYSALDWTDQGWIENCADDPDDIANGFDTRYLISFGSLQMAPAEVETVTVAYIGSKGWHTDPYNYQNNLRYNTRDSLSIAQYYSSLGISNLISNAEMVYSYYQSGIQYLPLGPPDGFNISEWDGEHIKLCWNHEDHDLLSEYRIYRDTLSDMSNPVLVSSPGLLDSTFTDSGLQDNTLYYYVICKLNIYSVEGGLSDVRYINTSQPLAPTGLTAESGDRQIQLSWQANPEDDIRGYTIWHKIEPVDNDTYYEIIDTVNSLSYLDTELANGYSHYYKIQAFDNSGNISFFSDSASAIPMGLNSGILLVNADRGDYPQIFPDYDSLNSFYEGILDNTGMQYDITTEEPDTVADFSPYEIVIWCREAAFRNFDINVGDCNSSVLRYMANGGKIIIAGIRIANLSSFGYEGTQYFASSSELFYEYMNLEGAEFSDIANTEFIGGVAENEAYSDFGVDTEKILRYDQFWCDDSTRLGGISVLMPRDSSEIIYTYNAVNPDTSSFHGRPLGIVHNDETYSTAVLEFPLYFIEEGKASMIINQILQEFGTVDIPENDSPALPENTSLLYNYPNPFNAQTQILFQLQQSSEVELTVYDILGRKVGRIDLGTKEAGTHSVIWDADQLSSGVYFYKIQADDYTAIKKCILLK